MNKFVERFDQALRILNKIVAVAKVITAPIWFPASLILKGLILLLPLFLLGMTSGCTSVSNHFDKSPCACEFRPLNTTKVEGSHHA